MLSKTTTSERLKQIMKLRNLRQVDILNLCAPYCKKYNVILNKSGLSQYVSGTVEPGQYKLSILGMALDVSEAWLMGYDVPMERPKENPDNKIELIAVIPDEPPLQILPQENIRNIPIFESVAAGFGAIANAYPIDYMPLYIENETEAAETICVTVKGDSMYPKIENGDIIQVRKQSSVDSGKIAVVLIDGEDAVVKKVIYNENTIQLISINPEYAPRIFSGSEVTRIQILGLVRKIIKSVD